VENKRQHFVPRSYLAGFVDPTTQRGHEPYLWVYERGQAEPYARAPKKVAIRSYYYSFATPSGKRDDVEKLLASLETSGIPVLRALVKGRNPADLSDAERRSFSFFVGMLDVRVPSFRHTIESFAARLIRDAILVEAQHPEYFERKMQEAHAAKDLIPPDDLEALREFVLSGEYTIQVDPLLSLQSLIKLAPTVAEYVYAYQWRVLEAPPDAAFITSDCPLVKVSTKKLPPPYGWGTGWETPWMEATLPLTTQHCLLLSQHHPGGREPIAPHTVEEVNWRTAALANNEVYSSKQIAPEVLNRSHGWEWWKPLTDVQ